MMCVDSICIRISLLFKKNYSVHKIQQQTIVLNIRVTCIKGASFSNPESYISHNATSGIILFDPPCQEIAHVFQTPHPHFTQALL